MVIGCAAEPVGSELDGAAAGDGGVDGVSLDGAVPDAGPIDGGPIDARVPQGAGPFAGAWLCQYAATTSFTAPIAHVQMSTGVDFIEIADGDAADLVIALDGPTGPCDVAADRAGDVATVRPGQTCTRTASGTTIVFTLTAGAATAAPDSLLLDLSGPVSGAMGSSTVVGTLATSYQCVHN